MRVTKHLSAKHPGLFVFFIFILVTGGCLLGDDIETLRQRAGEKPVIIISVPGNNFQAKTEWLSSNAVNGGNYVMELKNNETVDDFYWIDSGGKNITITVRGNSAITFLQYADWSRGIGLDSGVTLILEDGVSFIGLNFSEHQSFININVNENSALIMNEGVLIKGLKLNIYKGEFILNGGTITGGILQDNRGGSGGVYINEGTFTMNGGTITGNATTYSGGGVNIYNGTFVMNGGSITNNTASGGGGVHVNEGIFTMNGGDISANKAYRYYYDEVYGSYFTYGHGGGVSLYNNAAFNFYSGTISGNNAYTSGGGIDSSDGIINIYGGTISGNMTNDQGGGICVNRGSLNMKGGVISNNTVNNYNGGGIYMYEGSLGLYDGKINDNCTNANGGGIHLYGSDFYMEGGTILKNKANNQGGGVSAEYWEYDRSFIKTGGTIYGQDGGQEFKNESGDDIGHAVNLRWWHSYYFQLVKDNTSYNDNRLEFLPHMDPPQGDSDWDIY